MIKAFRKRPVVVEAVRWTGGNLEEVRELTGRDNFHVRNDPGTTASVYDKLHSTWVLVFNGQWVIRGVKGEFYPIGDDVLRETYEPVDVAGGGTAVTDEIVRDILEAVCRRDGLPLESTVAPGEPARNYELADRLGISRVFGLTPPGSKGER